MAGQDDQVPVGIESVNDVEELMTQDQHEQLDEGVNEGAAGGGENGVDSHPVPAGRIEPAVPTDMGLLMAQIRACFEVHRDESRCDMKKMGDRMDKMSHWMDTMGEEIGRKMSEEVTVVRDEVAGVGNEVRRCEERMERELKRSTAELQGGIEGLAREVEKLTVGQQELREQVERNGNVIGGLKVAQKELKWEVVATKRKCKMVHAGLTKRVDDVIEMMGTKEREIRMQIETTKVTLEEEISEAHREIMGVKEKMERVETDGSNIEKRQSETGNELQEEVMEYVQGWCSHRDEMLADQMKSLQVLEEKRGKGSPEVSGDDFGNVFGASGCSASLGERIDPGVREGPIVRVTNALLEVDRTAGHLNRTDDSTSQREYHVSYLSLRACIGLWTAFYCIILVATDASSLVCYITRFTEEAFASLICLIFIYEALEKLVHLGVTYPIHMHDDLNMLTLHTCTCAPPQVSNVTWSGTNQTVDTIAWENLTVSDCKMLKGEFVGNACSQKGPYVPDVLFWSAILFFSTFFLSGFLKRVKTTRYFPTKVRAIISDFAVFLTILSMVLLDYLVGIPSPKLKVPSVFKPTRNDRGWIVNPMGPNPWWTILVASLPALLCTILIFMDQQITAVIINRKEHKLKKGCGYHLDLLWVAIMLAVCSIMGLPWFVAATVLSISHVNSLKLESVCSAPGEQPRFLGIREQRFTGFMIFLLMGCSVFMTSVLQFIPMPVLYAVFLYMGVSSLKGIQFYDRIKLFGMPAKHQPDFIYLRHVPLRKVHLFTFIQLFCLVTLWIIKMTDAAIVFPMMILALLFIRKLMYTCFSKRELSWLDDVMPESRRKKLDDDLRQKKQDDEHEDGHSQDEDGHGQGAQEIQKTDMGSVEVPLKDGNVLKIPLKSIQYSSKDPSVINISDEMPKTSLWKAMAGTTRHRKQEGSKYSPEKDTSLVIPKIIVQTETSV
uniref:electroneutral sodium bicarbonate exchanger 1-like n=1 Tax=Myxine glutinosa TaxID=7769 RepID=UPI00358F38FE